ncbi:MAG: UDP-N-acetylglucosamine 3-dehydrogenase [Chloroflexota bacterium]|nr:UDP-N-acetylglucosamine 3-dehydrogenase [Chloroflexota bacterium]
MTSSWRPAGDRELRLGLAGLGSMGRNHLRVLSARTDLVLAAVADPVGAALASATGQTGAQGFAEPLAMIAEAELDGLVIAAPTTAHVPLALAAIERGVAILVEKPLAATTDEAMQIVTAARAAGVPVQVGHVERFNPAVLELGRLIDDGWLSTVYSIASRRAGPFPARIRDVGVTVDLATHDADILSWIAGERPSRVYAETAQRIHATNEDLLFGLLHFPSGATGMLDVNWLTPAKRRQLIVVGEEGMFELDYLTQRLTFTRATDTTNPRLIGGYAPTFEGEVLELSVASTEPLAGELEAFVSVIRAGGRPVVDAEDGLWAVAIATSLLAAAAEGRAVDLSTLSSRFAPA